MNTHIRTVGLFTIALCAIEAQAYTFSVTNNTSKLHHIQMKLAFLGETLNEVFTVAPKEKKDHYFGGLRIGLCLEQLAVDNQSVDIINVDGNQFDQIMKYVDNPKDLDMYLAASGVYNQVNRGWICGNKDFFLVESPRGFMMLTRNPMPMQIGFPGLR